MKKLFAMIVLLVFTGCIWIYRDEEYKIKFVENGYSYNSEYFMNRVYLTQPKGDDKYSRGRVVLGVKFNSMKEYGNNNLRIISGKEDFLIDNKWYNVEEEKYNKPEILDDIVITKKNGEKIIVNKEKIIYTYKNDPSTKFKEAKALLSEELTDPITLELGKVKIGDEIYDIPKIYMQKYRVTESVSILGSLLEEGGLYLPGYYSEGWVDD